MTRERLVVAVDFGTTFSGVAFCHSSCNGIKETEVVTNWANNGVAPKTPTEIRYLEGKEARWGAEASLPSERRRVKSTSPIYGRFKLLLDPTTENDIYGNDNRNIALGLANLRLQSPSSIELPPGKTAISVSTDYLRLLYTELMDKILRRRFPDTLDITPIEFVFTVPAIWGHKAQEATRYAAKSAGFCSRSTDNLSLVSEPEAAAIYVLRAMDDKNFNRISTQGAFSLKKGNNFVVCDAGGGTVDLISYEVEREHPNLVLSESAIGTGAKCGSSYIDTAFIEFLRQKLGVTRKDDSWFRKVVGLGSPLMKAFDLIKRSFGQTGNDVWFLEIGHTVPDNEEAGIMDNELEFTAGDLKALFDPIVDQIIGLVDKQVQSVRSYKGAGTIPAVLLVGGFGESHYLYQCLVKWAERKSPSLVIINPKESWSAIMRGAIVHVLQPGVRSRHLRQHYGFKCGIPFDPSKYDISDAYESPFGGWYLRNSVKWSAAMGDECDSERQIEFRVQRSISGTASLTTPISLELYGCRNIQQPTFSWDYGVYPIGTVISDFSGVDISTLESTMIVDAGTLKKRYKLTFVVRMNIGSADATFSIWSNKKCVGVAQIAHDEDSEAETISTIAQD